MTPVRAGGRGNLFRVYTSSGSVFGGSWLHPQPPRAKNIDNWRYFILQNARLLQIRVHTKFEPNRSNSAISSALRVFFSEVGNWYPSQTEWSDSFVDYLTQVAVWRLLSVLNVSCQLKCVLVATVSEAQCHRTFMKLHQLILGLSWCNAVFGGTIDRL